MYSGGLDALNALGLGEAGDVISSAENEFQDIQGGVNSLVGAAQGLATSLVNPFGNFSVPNWKTNAAGLLAGLIIAGIGMLMLAMSWGDDLVEAIQSTASVAAKVAPLVE